MAYAANINFATYSSYFIFSFSLRNPDHVKITNFATFTNHFDLTCPRLIFNDSLILFILIIDESSTHDSYFLLVSHDSWFWRENIENIKWLEYVAKFVLTAKAITWINPLSNTFGKICVCCIGHHVNKSSFKYFLWQNLNHPVELILNELPFNTE